MKSCALSDVPIIILTAKDSEINFAAGFSSGGDDYIIKPFRPSLLVMKIGALLKRVEQSAQQGEASGQLHYGDISTLMKRSSPAAGAWRSR